MGGDGGPQLRDRNIYYYIFEFVRCLAAILVRVHRSTVVKAVLGLVLISVTHWISSFVGVIRAAVPMVMMT